MTTTPEEEDASPLARFCRQRGWTRQQVGHLVGAHPSLVGRWWAGDVAPGCAYAARLVDLSGGILQPVDLLPEQERMQHLMWSTWHKGEGR